VQEPVILQTIESESLFNTPPKPKKTKLQKQQTPKQQKVSPPAKETKQQAELINLKLKKDEPNLLIDLR
jgi:hypothetical protein